MDNWNNMAIKITYEIAKAVHDELKLGNKQRDVACTFGLSTGSVSRISRGLHYGDRLEKLDNIHPYKVTESLARKIITYVVDHPELPKTEVGKIFNLSKSTVMTVCKGSIFPGLDRSGLKLKVVKRVFADRKVASKIYKEYKSGIKQRDLAKKYGFSNSYISRICTGKIYEDIGDTTKKRKTSRQKSNTQNSTNYREFHRKRRLKYVGKNLNQYGLEVPIGANTCHFESELVNNIYNPIL